jgi:hypothetical protein
MKYLLKYNNFLESIHIDMALINIDINESLGIYYENILKSVGAEEVDTFNTFKIPKDDFVDKLNLDVLTNNPEFINSLSSIGLKKSSLQNTDDLQTFVNKPSRFLLIYNIEANELENPIYMLFQSWNNTLEKWDDTKVFKINGDIKSFYDKLSSNVIEIEDDGDRYIYHTTNKSEWNLQNIDKENDKFKKYFRSDEFQNFINSNKFKINII